MVFFFFFFFLTIVLVLYLPSDRLSSQSPGSVIVQLEVGAVEAEAESLIQTANQVLTNDSALGLDPKFFLVQDIQGL